MIVFVRVCNAEQMQEFRTGATRQNMETTHVKEESKRLRQQLGDLRDKLADLDAKVVLLIIATCGGGRTLQVTVAFVVLFVIVLYAVNWRRTANSLAEAACFKRAGANSI